MFCICILYMHSVHVLCTCVLYMCSAHAFCTCVLYMHSVHVFCTCILYMHSVHVFCTYILYMHSVHVFCTCILYMHSVHVFCTCVLYMHNPPVLHINTILDKLHKHCTTFHWYYATNTHLCCSCHVWRNVSWLLLWEVWGEHALSRMLHSPWISIPSGTIL